MNEYILELKPKNLPTYIYKLDAHVAFVHKRIAYKLKAYCFSTITIAVNQPLRPGDVLSEKCCYFGNMHIEIIHHLQNKYCLNGATEEFKYYSGCKIDRLSLCYVEDKDHSSDPFVSCGNGECTVFIPMLTSSAGYKFTRLDARNKEDLTIEELETLELLRKELVKSGELEYWKKRIPYWDTELENIGEVPHNLIYDSINYWSPPTR
jgi:hypothetical protein